KEGHKVLLSDGLIELFVNKVFEDKVECLVTKGGRLRSRAGISFPDSTINLPAATDKDLQDIKWGVEQGVDFVAVSFVQNALDLKKLKEEINEAKEKVPLIAKIERKAALENIEEIAEEADGIMVARGDLGLELPLEKLPHIQQDLIELGHLKGIPVIVATQMLHSMVTSNRPTRAEVTDIAAAVTAGADALMLSEETAIGEHPILAVEYLRKIAAEAENVFDHERHIQKLISTDSTTVPEAVAVAAVAAAGKIKAAGLVACTESGNTARLISKYRPRQIIFGVSASETAIRRMCLYAGVMPISFREPKDHYDELARAIEAVKERINLPPKSRLVLTGGLSVRTPGATSVMEIREIE
ncbi:MAG: pyruvate kinase, partial [Candidatus Dadabacteria bacterium]